MPAGGEVTGTLCLCTFLRTLAVGFTQAANRTALFASPAEKAQIFRSVFDRLKVTMVAWKKKEEYLNMGRRSDYYLQRRFQREMKQTYHKNKKKNAFFCVSVFHVIGFTGGQYITKHQERKRYAVQTSK